jgi:Tim10/DDP family zinc finger
MGWFGGSSDKSEGAMLSALKDFSSDDVAAFSGIDSASVSSLGGTTSDEMIHFAQKLQQQVLIQQVITVMTDVAFAKCITGKPSNSLLGREAASVHATVNKWMDTNEFMLG